MSDEESPVAGGLVEIGDYHYREDRFDEYRLWAEQAAKILHDRLDVLGFWVDVGVPARVAGSVPMDLPHGSANVTWIIRWQDMVQREASWEALWQDREWTDQWDKHPGFEGYLHMSVRFLEEACASWKKRELAESTRQAGTSAATHISRALTADQIA